MRALPPSWCSEPLAGGLEIQNPNPCPLCSDLVDQICIFLSVSQMFLWHPIQGLTFGKLEQVISVTLSKTHLFIHSS